jgi:surface carbohydrate biosynthesis protein
MKTVYFHIDEVARDAVVASALKIKLEKYGIKLFYGNRNFESLFKKIHFPFDLAIFPSVDLVESTFVSPERVNFPIFILPTESVTGRPETRYRLVQHLLGTNYAIRAKEDWLNKITHFCLWGEKHLNIIENIMPEIINRCSVIGHPRHDSYCLIKNNHTVQIKKNIGLVSRFDILNIFDGRSNLNFIYDMMKKRNKPLEYFQVDDRDVEDMWYVMVQDLKIFFTLIDNIDDEKFSISIRIHPRENRYNWENLVKLKNLPIQIAQWDEPFNHWLEKQDIIITTPSTSLYDCALRGKRAITIQNIFEHREEHTNIKSDDYDPILSFFESASSFKELLELLSTENIIDPPKQLLQLMKDETNYPESHKSLDNLSNIINNVKPTLKKRDYLGIIQYYLHREYISIQYYRNKITEQSVSFPLNRKRRQWIDSLVSN